MFCSRPNVGGWKQFGPGNKRGRGETNESFFAGPVFEPRLGYPVGWAAFPAGVGLTKQSLRGVEDFHSAQRHLYLCSPLCHSFNGNGIEEMKNYNGWHTGS
jgi:hypothetical protein